MSRIVADFGRAVGKFRPTGAQGSVNRDAPNLLESLEGRIWRNQMNWFPDQVDAAMIAGAVSFNAAFIVALAAAILALRRLRRSFDFEFAAEGLARAMLSDRKIPYRSFRFFKYHLSGFTDDELRKILVRAGAIRLMAGGEEVWGLLAHNRKFLSAQEISEAPVSQILADPLRPKQEAPRPDIGQADEPDAETDSSGAFARVRAEMIRLGKLECVRPAVRQE